MRRERGFVLLTALLILIVLSLLGARMVSLARIDTQTARLRLEAALLEAAADGALRHAIFDLLAAGAQRGYVLALPGARAVIRCENLGGHINPNLATPALFRGLLLAVGADPATAGRLAAALATLRGPRADGVIRVAAAGQGPGPASPEPGNFETVAGLAVLPGMTPALLAALAPHLSVWWPGPPDPAQAGPAVRRALAEAGEQDLAAATRPQERVVRISASLTSPTGRRLVRRIIVRLGLALDGSSWRILAGDPPEP